MGKPKRGKIKAKGVTNQGVTQGVTDSLKQPSPLKQVDSFTSNGVVFEVERTPKGYIRVSKPGDSDYDGICTPEWRAARGR